MTCQPARWLWGLIPIAMLSWIAVDLEGRRIETDLEPRSAAALAAAGIGRAHVVFSGRDGILVGLPGGSAKQQQALALIDSLWGVHSVRARQSTDMAILSLPASDPDTASDSHIHDMPHLAPTTIARAVDDLDLSVFETPAAAEEPLERVQAAAGKETVGPPAPAVGSAKLTAPVPEKKASANRVRGEKAASPEAPMVAMGTAIPVPSRKVAAVRDTADTGAHKPASQIVATGGPAIPVPHRKPVARGLAATATKATSPQAPTIATGTLPENHTAPSAACMAAVQDAGRAAQLHFARGAAALNTRGKALLDRLAAAVTGCPQASVHISGHTDAAGRGRRNLALSRRRARSVAVYLINKGIDAGRVEAVGYGETRPVAPNNNRANRAKNRRIEVVTSQRDANAQIRSSAMQGTDHGLSDR